MTDIVIQVVPLGSPPWPTIDPFLFCVHHDDAYPAGTAEYGPATSLRGRSLGQDFSGLNGWSMYHGQNVPGFPRHPHRGFETVTVTRRGVIDHADSLGAAARYGEGDVQWMTAGAGIVHAEMFPLLSSTTPNPVELFQIWVNLPSDDKFVDPYFTMLWADGIRRDAQVDAEGKVTEITMIAGAPAAVPNGTAAEQGPPPNSWAARPDADMAIWTLRMQPGGRYALPPAKGADTVRTLYVFAGSGVQVGGREIGARHAIVVRPDVVLPLTAGPGGAEILLLQGRPIGEPVVQYGPFVMNDRAGIEKAFDDYHRTQFGGWPWPKDDPVHAEHASTGTRFARHADGRLERVGGAA